MARKEKITAKVISQKQIAEQIFDLRLETKLAKDAHPGQFVAVYPKSESTLLPRPISICETDKRETRIFDGRRDWDPAPAGIGEGGGRKKADFVGLSE